ncbi:MAG: hypothetical protein H7174_10835 [Flavobacterium sp.]|nr:hypothetical protein [Flavobacterium sp.]
MLDFFKRLDKFINFSNLNDNKLTISCGISNGLIGKARNRGSLSQENISKILLKYENLDANWLMTGRGKMINENYIFNKNRKCLSIIPVENMINFHNDNENLSDNLLINRFLPSNISYSDFLIEIKNNINTQKYSIGDYLACKKLSLEDVFFQWNNICVLDTAFGIWIKKIMKGKDEDHFLILSENQSYDPFEIHISEIKAIALVLGVVKLE